MSAIAKGVHAGTRVKQGQTIGYVGSTGLATGPHLCYRFWKNGVQVDALKVDLPASHPIKKEFTESFEAMKNEWIDKLKRIPFEQKAEETLAAL
jgi:murein DD-endopeptidase MepM/ murein hydrolase activator NlpD